MTDNDLKGVPLSTMLDYLQKLPAGAVARESFVHQLPGKDIAEATIVLRWPRKNEPQFIVATEDTDD